MKKLFVLLFVVSLNVWAFDYNPWVLFKKIQASRSFAKKDYEQAKKNTQELITHNPHDAESLYNAGKASYALNDFKQAEHYFDAAVQEFSLPELKKRSFFDKGNSQLQQQELERALESYKKVVELDPHHEKAPEMIKKIEEELEKKKQQNQEQENQDQHNKNSQNQQKSGNKNDQQKD
jgi:Ca-activated chloride channel family protein